MEEQVYKRQINKLNLSTRVVDAKGADRHYEESDLSQLYTTENIEPCDVDRSDFGKVNDEMLMEILREHDMIYKCHCHDSLLQDVDDSLTQDEKNEAWEDFEHDKKLEKKAPEVLTSKITDDVSEDIDIYGFSTSELLELLTLKAQRNLSWNREPNQDVKEEIPALYTKFLNQMANDDLSVIIHILIYVIIIYFDEKFSFSDVPRTQTATKQKIIK